LEINVINSILFNGENEKNIKFNKTKLILKIKLNYENLKIDFLNFSQNFKQKIEKKEFKDFLEENEVGKLKIEKFNNYLKQNISDNFNIYFFINENYPNEIPLVGIFGSLISSKNNCSRLLFFYLF
jgi:hypothetical protein